jgi:hypothetical protein
MIALGVSISNGLANAQEPQIDKCSGVLHKKFDMYTDTLLIDRAMR